MSRVGNFRKVACPAAPCEPRSTTASRWRTPSRACSAARSGSSRASMALARRPTACCLSARLLRRTTAAPERPIEHERTERSRPHVDAQEDQWRRQQRGRIRGEATRSNTVAFGDFGLQAIEPGWVSARVIEAGRIACGGTPLKARSGSASSRTSRSQEMAETRQGSGKGDVDFWAAVVKPGTVIYEPAGSAKRSRSAPSTASPTSSRSRSVWSAVAELIVVRRRSRGTLR